MSHDVRRWNEWIFNARIGGLETDDYGNYS
jgi:hypothetical protein